MRALTVYWGSLIVGGFFTTAGGATADFIAGWTPNYWWGYQSGVDGVSGPVLTFTVYDGRLIAGGFFSTPAVGVAALSGNYWSPLRPGAPSDIGEPNVHSLTAFAGKLVIGGHFSAAGTTAANNIVTWDGGYLPDSWSALCRGVVEGTSVLALTVYNNQLIVGGDFTTAGNISANNIAAWSESGNSLPTACIDNITPNPALAGMPVSFGGHGTDCDGTITGYNWRSSIDGQLSTSASFSKATLSEGTHTIFFSVQDDDGEWSPEVSYNLSVNFSADQLRTLITAVGEWEKHYIGYNIYAASHGAGRTYKKNFQYAHNVVNAKQRAGFDAAKHMSVEEFKSLFTGVAPELNIGGTLAKFALKVWISEQLQNRYNLLTDVQRNFNLYEQQTETDMIDVVDARIREITQIDGVGTLEDLTNAVDARTQAVLSAIPSQIPSGYPINPTYDRLLDYWMKLHSYEAFGFPYANECDFMWGHPLVCDPITNANYIKLGSTANLYNLLDQEINQFVANRRVQNKISTACSIWDAGGMLMKIGISVSGVAAGGLGALVTTGFGEVVYNTVSSACYAEDVLDEVAVMDQSLSMLFHVDALIGNAIEDSYRSYVTYSKVCQDLITSFQNPSTAPCGGIIEVTDISTPDLCVRPGIASSSYQDMTITLHNKSMSERALAGVVMTINTRQPDNVMGYYPRFVEVPANGTLPVTFNVYGPPNADLNSRGYLADIKVFTHDEVISRLSYFWSRKLPCSPFYDYATANLASGYLSLAKRNYMGSILITNSVKNAEFAMTYGGSDFNLHVYDDLGRHVGYDDSTASVELEIPGAFYSGNASNPEIIRFPNSGEHSYTLRVEAIQVQDSEYFSVAALQEVNHPATMEVTPSELSTGGHPGDTLSDFFIIREIGGQYAINGITINASDIVGTGNGQMILESTIILDYLTTVPADSAMFVSLKTFLPSSLQFGTLHGSIAITSSAGAITVPINLTVSPPLTCGDANGDGAVDISDAVYLISYIFSGGLAPILYTSGDANCDSTVDISDVVYLIAYIFSGGLAPCAGCK